VGDVVDIQGKTEQRCTAVVDVLRSATGPMSYDDIRLATGGRRGADGRVEGGIAYDILLYLVTTLMEVGLVKRTKIETRKPGNPRVQFTWTGKLSARVSGTRSAKAA
jgi:hypothetical protein